MRRNPLRKADAEIRAGTVRAVTRAASQMQAGAGSGSVQRVGGNDPATGAWVGYGLVGVTTLGTGFRVKGD